MWPSLISVGKLLIIGSGTFAAALRLVPKFRVVSLGGVVKFVLVEGNLVIHLLSWAQLTSASFFPRSVYLTSRNFFVCKVVFCPSRTTFSSAIQRHLRG